VDSRYTALHFVTADGKVLYGLTETDIMAKDSLVLILRAVPYKINGIAGLSLKVVSMRISPPTVQSAEETLRAEEAAKLAFASAKSANAQIVFM
jgi:hypothetical protein